MRVAVAQTRPMPGDVAHNLARHLALIELAADAAADLVIFPELSVTGYEPKLAARLAFAPDDARLDPCQAESDAREMVITVGVPARAAAGVEISQVVFRPGQPRLRYSKQLLHADEMPWFRAGDRQLVIEAAGTRVVPAICYESLQPSHADGAARLGADLYAASVAKSATGLAGAERHYPAIARKHSMWVVMSNCVGPCDDFVAAGRSAAWTPDGARVASLDDTSMGLLVVDTADGQWSSVMLPEASSDRGGMSSLSPDAKAGSRPR